MKSDGGLYVTSIVTFNTERKKECNYVPADGIHFKKSHAFHRILTQCNPNQVRIMVYDIPTENLIISSLRGLPITFIDSAIELIVAEHI